MAGARAIRGSVGDWVLRLQSPDRKRLVDCIPVISDTVPRVRFELSEDDGVAECAIELVSQERAEEVLEALGRFFKRRRGHIRYTLGHVTTPHLDSGILVDR